MIVPESFMALRMVVEALPQPSRGSHSHKGPWPKGAHKQMLFQVPGQPTVGSWHLPSSESSTGSLTRRLLWGVGGPQGGAGPWGGVLPHHDSAVTLRPPSRPHACYCVTSQVGLGEPVLHTLPSGGPSLTILASEGLPSRFMCRWGDGSDISGAF